MIKVSINTFGSVNKDVGWNSKEVKLQQARATIEDILRTVKLKDGRTLFDLVADDNGTRDGYTILVNGRALQNPENLKLEIKNEDLVTAMNILYPIGGG